MPPVVLTATATAAGAATITFNDTGHDYTLQQIAVSAPSATTGVCSVSVDGAYIMGTTTGWGDTADGTPPLQLNRGQVLTIAWAGLPAATPVTATLFGLQQ